MGIRTDLALEAKELWQQSAAENTKLHGVRARQREKGSITVDTVQILDETGARALGKPVGTYETLELSGDWEEAARVLSVSLGELMQLEPEERVLVVGLGNREMTPDALGPLTALGILVTRHLADQAPFRGLRQVSTVTPGVLGTTGVESLEVVRGVVERTEPDRVIVIDALAAGQQRRLCTTVQLTDTGIVPGSGVGNARAAFNLETLGVPVYAVGVPTVMDAPETDPPMTVTSRDIDVQIRRLSRLLARGINGALFPDLSACAISQIVEF